MSMPAERERRMLDSGGWGSQLKTAVLRGVRRSGCSLVGLGVFVREHSRFEDHVRLLAVDDPIVTVLKLLRTKETGQVLHIA